VRLKFAKMHGLGNDFMVINALRDMPPLSPQVITRLADRKRGVGFDQLLLVKPASDGLSDFRYEIFNADGSCAEQCGNGARCVAEFVAREGLADAPLVRWQTVTAPMTTQRYALNDIEVTLAEPDFSAAAVGYLGADLQVVSMGNPHAVIAVHDVQAIDAPTMAAGIVARGEFTNGVNVGFVQTLARDAIRVRVVERGVGETQACGSGACAAVAVGIRAGALDSNVGVQMRGGDLRVRWAGPSHPLYLRGAATFVFAAEIEI